MCVKVKSKVILDKGTGKLLRGAHLFTRYALQAITVTVGAGMQ